VCDKEKLQMASSWKAEKLALEAERDKLQKELDFTKSNLERFAGSFDLMTLCVLRFHQRSGWCFKSVRESQTNILSQMFWVPVDGI